MPEYKAPKQEKAKKEKPQKEHYDKSQVVSAYSEEGQRRAKQNRGLFSTSYKIVFFSLLALMIIAFTIFVLWRNGVIFN